MVVTARNFTRNIQGLKMDKIAICVGILNSLLLASMADEVSFHGHQLWRVIPKTASDLRILQEIGEAVQLDFWKIPTTIGRQVDFQVSLTDADDVSKRLDIAGMPDHQVVIDDIQALIDRQRDEHNAKIRTRANTEKTVKSFDYSRYHTPDEVYEWMDMVKDEYEDFTEKVQFGVTYEGRPMYVLIFKKGPPTKAKPTIFVDSLIHCREWITTASLLFIFKEMLQNPVYNDMMTDVDWYFVPMINIDGYEETWSGNRLWRKTRSTGSSSFCTGTDGNRNWDAFWSIVPGSSTDPCSNIFHGPTPESESEVRHLANYVISLGEGKINSYISTHSASQLILYPYVYNDTVSADDAIQNEVGKLQSEAVKKVHSKTYVYGPGATTIYPASGTTTDWTYEVAHIILSFTYELRDTGEYGHLLPADQIIPNGQEYLAGLEAVKDYVLENYELGSGEEI